MAKGGRLMASAVACLAVVAGTTFVHVGVAQAESNGGVKIMPLGDSITDGLTVAGGYRIELWKKLVAGKYTVDFVGSLSNGPATLGDHDHEGHSGWTISQIDSNITNWLQKYTPHTILLHIGTNDMYNASGAPSRLGTLLDHITTQAPDADVFVATIIPLSSNNSAVQTYNAQIPNLVKTRANAGKHLYLVDMYSKLTTSDLADGVHPNAGGYSKMATAWYDALVKVPGSLVKPGSPTPSTSAVPTPSASRS
jgi:lysophospholipase L1-like esterase